MSVDTLNADLATLRRGRTKDQGTYAPNVEFLAALDRVEAELARLREGLRKIQKFQPNRVAWYRTLGIVFERAPGCAPTEWEAVAFWTYTDLCEIESIARALLAEDDAAREDHDLEREPDDGFGGAA